MVHLWNLTICVKKNLQMQRADDTITLYYIKLQIEMHCGRGSAGGVNAENG